MVSTTARAAQACGGCGGACAAKRRARTTGMAGLLCPPQRIRAGHKPCKYFLFVWGLTLDPQGIKNKIKPSELHKAWQKCNGSSWKKMDRGSAKMAVRQNKIHYYFFQLILFCLTAMRVFFKCWNEAFGVTCCRGHKQKVLALHIILLAMPKDGKVARWACGLMWAGGIFWGTGVHMKKKTISRDGIVLIVVVNLLVIVFDSTQCLLHF